MPFKHSKWLYDTSDISVILQTNQDLVFEMQNSASWKGLSVQVNGSHSH